MEYHIHRFTGVKEYNCINGVTCFNYLYDCLDNANETFQDLISAWIKKEDFHIQDKEKFYQDLHNLFKTHIEQSKYNSCFFGSSDE